jgi:hypothetical protein
LLPITGVKSVYLTGVQWNPLNEFVGASFQTESTDIFKLTHISVLDSTLGQCHVRNFHKFYPAEIDITFM